MEDREKCILEGCNWVAKCRGLCHTHYNMACAQIHEGATWEQFEKHDPPLALPSKRTPNPFRAARQKAAAPLPGQKTLFGERRDDLQEEDNDILKGISPSKWFRSEKLNEEEQ